MLHHQVLVVCHPEATAAERTALVEGLRALPAQIPSISTYDVSEDAGLAEGNAHIAIHATFSDETAWRAYLAHPAHRSLVDTLLDPIRASSMRMQWTA